MILKGKGFYIWKIPNCENGDPYAIAQAAHQAGLTYVLIKIANGIYDYNYDISTGKDLITPVANALHAKNIKVWGWHYVFGNLPKDEAKTAIRQLNKLPLDGYVIDAESEYKGKYTPCRIFMQDLRNALQNFPIALSSFRYPKYHMDLPWTDFLKKCDFNMPQVYWEQSHNPAYQLERSLTEFQTAVSPFRPYLPTGAAYCAGGWCPTADEIIKFMDKAVELELSAVNFWSWDYCRLKLPHLWDAIANYNWPSAPNPEKSLLEKYFDYLNMQNADILLDLYTSDAIHINAARTIQGKTAVRNYFQDFLSDFQSNTIFSLNSMSGTNDTKHFSWTAKNGASTIAEGEDTVGISGDLIIYHYSSYCK